MGLLSFLSGNSKSVEKIVDAGVNGVDALFYTEEEKAQHRQEMQKLYHKYVEIAASESTTQSISRRMICLPVVYVWLFLILLDVGTQMMGYMFPAIGNAITQMNTPALAAIGFYVGRHLVANYAGKK
jgi:hypothetical protein